MAKYSAGGLGAVAAGAGMVAAGAMHGMPVVKSMVGGIPSGSLVAGGLVVGGIGIAYLVSGQ